MTLVDGPSSQELHNAVTSALEERGYSAAVAVYQHLTGVEVTEALAAVRRMSSPQSSRDATRRIDCSVTAVGPFGPGIVEHLDYPAERYHNMQPGDPVLATPVLVHTPAERERLATGLGIKTWDFNRHVLKPRRFSREALLELLPPAEVDALYALHEAGFSLHFDPGEV